MSQYTRRKDFDPEDFLKNYWQQKPLLIKDFLSGFKDPLSPGELAGLALEDGVESRLVEMDSASSYHLRHGPFQEADFLALPEQHWTLLVQAADQWVPRVCALKSVFDFLPAWRIDDVMVSHAVIGGSVGPHFDQYDVFLLQGSGSRTWKLGGHCSAEHLQVQESGLKLLKNFEQEQEVTLQCGDILYIPPGVAHWGIGTTPGLCYSIGFRAPGQAEMIESLSDLLIDEANEFQRYRDTHPGIQQSRAEISATSLAEAWRDLKSNIVREDLFYRAFGALVTRPRYPELIVAPRRTQSLSDIQSYRKPAIQLLRNTVSRFAWMREEENSRLLVFVDGEVFFQPRANLQAVTALCDVTPENINDINPPSDEEAWTKLLLQLVNLGSLLPIEAGHAPT